MRRAAKRDANEPSLRLRAELNGWTILPVSSPGEPDWNAVRDGVVRPCEIKMPDGDLTPRQREVFARYAAAGYVVPILVTEDDVNRELPPCCTTRKAKP